MFARGAGQRPARRSAAHRARRVSGCVLLPAQIQSEAAQVDAVAVVASVLLASVFLASVFLASIVAARDVRLLVLAVEVGAVFARGAARFFADRRDIDSECVSTDL